MSPAPGPWLRRAARAPAGAGRRRRRRCRRSLTARPVAGPPAPLGRRLASRHRPGSPPTTARPRADQVVLRTRVRGRWRWRSEAGSPRSWRRAARSCRSAPGGRGRVTPDGRRRGASRPWRPTGRSVARTGPGAWRASQSRRRIGSDSSRYASWTARNRTWSPVGAVGVVALGQPSMGGLDLLVGRAAGHAQLPVRVGDRPHAAHGRRR